MTTIKLRNVELSWANLAKPDAKYGKLGATISLDADGVKALEEAGVGEKVKTGDNGDKFIKVSEAAAWPSGDAKTVKVVNKGLEEVAVETVNKIGNGTVANVNLTVKPYNNSFGKGMSVFFAGVQIVELKEYDGGSSDGGFDDISGEF